MSRHVREQHGAVDHALLRLPGRQARVELHRVHPLQHGRVRAVPVAAAGLPLGRRRPVGARGEEAQQQRPPGLQLLQRRGEARALAQRASEGGGRQDPEGDLLQPGGDRRASGHVRLHVQTGPDAGPPAGRGRAGRRGDAVQARGHQRLPERARPAPAEPLREAKAETGGGDVFGEDGEREDHAPRAPDDRRGLPLPRHQPLVGHEHPGRGLQRRARRR
mmetsp:Transcript_66123/g.173355  ORF Transcript_66123/g.173355 Transcript_66123/m.173355 type:complete len:219 (-) Transcript_66123:615-1271(-)